MTIIYKNAKYELTFEKKTRKFKLAVIDIHCKKKQN